MPRVAIIAGRNPRECPNHGKPTNNRGDVPTYCIDCDRAVRSYGHPCWRHVKPKPQVQVDAEQKAEAEELEKRKSFAERMHGRKLKVAKTAAKEAVTPLTAEQKAEIKEAERVARILRKANKTRRALGLGKKPR